MFKNILLIVGGLLVVKSEAKTSSVPLSLQSKIYSRSDIISMSSVDGWDVGNNNRFPSDTEKPDPLDFSAIPFNDGKLRMTYVALESYWYRSVKVVNDFVPKTGPLWTYGVRTTAKWFRPLRLPAARGSSVRRSKCPQGT